MQGRDVSKAVGYQISSLFKERDVIDHKLFGIGVVARVLDDDKIEVAFSKGMKVLVHDR